MKLGETIIKLGLAIAAVAGIAFLIVKYMDAIKAWAEKLCPCCRVEDEVIEEAEEQVEEPAAEPVPPVTAREPIAAALASSDPVKPAVNPVKSPSETGIGAKPADPDVGVRFLLLTFLCANKEKWGARGGATRRFKTFSAAFKTREFWRAGIWDPCRRMVSRPQKSPA